jgi:hypothetical protein
MLPIRISSPKVEGILQVSKWLKTQVLLDFEEMQELLCVLHPVDFVVVSELVPREGAVISADCFLRKYADYIHLLKQGEVPLSEDFRKYFSCAMTADFESFYAIAAGGERVLVKPVKPVVQLQAHHFFYSDLTGKFHPMVLSEESVTWGIQFSYPQLFQDLKTRQIAKVMHEPDFSNSALFLKLSRWIRSFTLPAPFEKGGVRVNAPMRIGRKCLAWIKNHPQLKKKGIAVSPILQKEG